MKKRLLFFLFRLLPLVTLSAQGTSPVNPDTLAVRMLHQLSVYPQEKVHLHIDRSAYLPGDTVRLRAYLTHATFHTETARSRYLLVEVVSPQDSLISRVKLRVNDDHSFHGYIPLPARLPDGDYTLRAYTAYMMAEGEDLFFKRKLTIVSSPWPAPPASRRRDFHVSFYPEGGYLLSGQECRLAFKALDYSGHPVDVRVRLEDGQGEVVTSDSTYYEGMGRLVFTPLAGETYRAYCTAPDGVARGFDIPEALAGVPGLRVDADAERIKVRLLRPMPSARADSLYLIAHVRGGIVFADRWPEDTDVLVFPKHLFPSGVVQFLLLDRRMNAVAERLSFCYHGQTATAGISTDKAVYAPRQPIKMTFALTAPHDRRRLKGKLSVSVTDSGEVPADTCFNILSTLLLTSELKGYIGNPSYYLHPDRRAQQALDLLLMIHGWRRYDLAAIARGEVAMPEREPETSFALSGEVKKYSPFEKRKQYMVFIQGANNSFMETAPTDKDGRFLFNDIEYPDGAGFTLRAVATHNNTTLQSLTVDEEEFPAVLSCVPQGRYGPLATEGMALTAEGSDNGSFSTERSGMKHFVLPEVTVKACYWGTTDYDNYSNQEVNAPVQKTVKDLLKNLGIRVVGKGRAEDGMLYQSFYYNKTRVVTFIDNQCSPQEGGMELIYGTALGDIDRMTFLRDVDRDIVEDMLAENDYVSRWEYMKRDNLVTSVFDIPYRKEKIPVLDIYLKKTSATLNPRRPGHNWRRRRSVIDRKTVYPLGYQKPVEFYSPVYDAARPQGSGKEDVRKTIFWQPVLVMDGTREQVLTFYAADRKSVYSVVVEGVTENGDIVYERKRIEVK